jgi:hypothetical protein
MKKKTHSIPKLLIAAKAKLNRGKFIAYIKNTYILKILSLTRVLNSIT